jgi:hypothetical protein
VINGWKEFYGWKGLSMERSIDRDNVQIKARRIWKSLIDEDSTVIDDSNNIESKVVKIVDTQNSTKEILSFMASQGS